MGAEGHGHGGKLSAGRAVERHVALHGERGAAGRRRQPVMRRLRMGAAGLAVALEVVPPAQDVALAGEAQHVHAGDDLRHAAGHRHRGGLQAAGDEAAVGPGLVDEIDLETEGLSDLVVVDAERPADVDGESVDVAALEAGVGERRLERARRERELGSRAGCGRTGWCRCRRSPPCRAALADIRPRPQRRIRRAGPSAACRSW